MSLKSFEIKIPKKSTPSPSPSPSPSHPPSTYQKNKKKP
jgi:hypothetical protein